MGAAPPIDAVVAVIERSGRFLFVRRSAQVPGAGHWCPVSGRVEPGESQRQAVRREAHEEVGVAARAHERLEEIVTPDGAYRLHYWHATLAPGEPRVESEEVTDVGWFTLAELRSLHPTFEDDVRVCERLAATRRRPSAQAGRADPAAGPEATYPHPSTPAARGRKEHPVMDVTPSPAQLALLDRLSAPELRGVVGVLRSGDADRAEAQAEAAVAAGLACIEITWTTPGAPSLVRRLRERHPGLLVGAGSAFTDDDVASACDAGAEFVVSPHLSERVAAACAARDVVYVPGVATPSEAVRATELGHSLLKLFPIAQLGGPDFVRALLGPMPSLRTMVTGGVGPQDVPTYLAAGATLVGLGSLFAPDDAETRRRVEALLRG